MNNAEFVAADSSRLCRPGDLSALAKTLSAAVCSRRVLVAIDGVDGSGKTTMAIELASRIGGLGRSVVLIHVDDFMHLKQVRHRRGRTSPLGYFLDSYDYEALIAKALRPLGPSGDGRYQAGITDRNLDVRVEFPVLSAPERAVVIVEGLFLLRDELFEFWDYSIFVASDRQSALQRKSARDGLIVDPNRPLGRRYLDGQKLYLDSCQPHERATWLFDPSSNPRRLNNDSYTTGDS